MILDLSSFSVLSPRNTHNYLALEGPVILTVMPVGFARP